MAKELFEFYCSGGCKGYFRTKLRTNIDGDYTIECPNCKHHHYRQIRGGRIRSERCVENSNLIMVPKSAYSDKPVMEHPDAGDKEYDSAVTVDANSKRWLLWGRYAKGEHYA